MENEIKFPVYRKYLNEKHYFRIADWGHMEELSRLGDRWYVHELSAKILPDRNLIYDLVCNYHQFAVAVSEEEYLAVKSTITT